MNVTMIAWKIADNQKAEMANRVILGKIPWSEVIIDIL